VVALLAAGGYAGLPRFAAPAGALVCVLGAAGFGRLLAFAAGERARRTMAVAFALVLGLALLVQGALRAATIPGELEAAADHGRRLQDLRALVEDVDPERVRSCGVVATADFYTQTALAWLLELPVEEIAIRIESPPTAGTMWLGRDAPASLREAVAASAQPLARHGDWSAYAVSCTEAHAATSGLARRY